MEKEGRGPREGRSISGGVALFVCVDDREFLLGQVWPEGEEGIPDSLLGGLMGGGFEGGVEAEGQGANQVTFVNLTGEGDDSEHQPVLFAEDR